MKARIPHRPALILAAAAVAAGASGLFAAAPAAAQTYTPLPAHVYAPNRNRPFVALEDLPPLAGVQLVRPRRCAAAGAPA